MPHTSRGPLLDHLDTLEERCRHGDPTLKEIVTIFGLDGHYILIAFLIIPFLQPIPLMGLSTPFGGLIAIIAILAYLNKPAILPQKWAHKKIPAKTVSRIAESSERVFEKLTLILHPRWTFLFRRPFNFVSMVLLVANAILLALPLPIPFSNAIPAWMIAFQALAHLEEDGLFIVISYLQTAVCLLYFFVLAKGLGKGLALLGL